MKLWNIEEKLKQCLEALLQLKMILNNGTRSYVWELFPGSNNVASQKPGNSSGSDWGVISIIQNNIIQLFKKKFILKWKKLLSTFSNREKMDF